jgi:hypothetical protein
MGSIPDEVPAMMEMVPAGAIVVTVAFLIASQRPFKVLQVSDVST